MIVTRLQWPPEIVFDLSLDRRMSAPFLNPLMSWSIACTGLGDEAGEQDGAAGEGRPGLVTADDLVDRVVEGAAFASACPKTALQRHHMMHLAPGASTARVCGSGEHFPDRHFM